MWGATYNFIWEKSVGVLLMEQKFENQCPILLCLRANSSCFGNLAAGFFPRGL